jgi:hypothetical protein
MDSIIRFLGWGFNECLERGADPGLGRCSWPIASFQRLRFLSGLYSVEYARPLGVREARK